MSTKRFAWKDRDTAALDLVQLAYHAPQLISIAALLVLSAIHSEVIVPELKEITLDPDRSYWERVCALRAIRHVPRDIYFPELISFVEEDLLKYEHAISKAKGVLDEIDHVGIFDDMVDEIIVFAAWHPSNRIWLWDCLDDADPLIVASIYANRLFMLMPEEMTITLVHRLIVLLDAYPTLLTLHYVHKIYSHNDSNIEAQIFLKKHFDAIVEMAISSSPAKRSQYELSSAIPFEWSELKAAIFQRRPDFEEKSLRDEAMRAAQRSKFEENRREDSSYKETAIWQELETLYLQVKDGDNQAFGKLHRKCYDAQLSIPVRAAATHFFAKLRDRVGMIERLALLTRMSGDTWENYDSPIRFEAGRALFEIATPEAWEALVAAFFVNPTNMLQDYLWDWIEALTDMLSGVESTYEGNYQWRENRWFKALSNES